MIFDTGTTLAYIPSMLYEGLIQELTKGINVTADSSGLRIGRLRDMSQYPSLYIHINTTWFEMTPKYYLIPLEEEYLGYDCVVGLSSGSQFLLGDTFLKNYYSIHDNENSRIGFVPSVTSEATLD